MAWIIEENKIDFFPLNSYSYKLHNPCFNDFTQFKIDQYIFDVKINSLILPEVKQLIFN